MQASTNVLRRLMTAKLERRRPPNTRAVRERTARVRDTTARTLDRRLGTSRFAPFLLRRGLGW